MYNQSITAIQKKFNAKTEPLNFWVMAPYKNDFFNSVDAMAILKQQANIKNIYFIDKPLPNGDSFIIGEDVCYYTYENYENFIFKNDNNDEIEKELKHLEGLLDKINAKLSNEKFLKNAKPEIVELEYKKQVDTENKIRLIKRAI